MSLNDPIADMLTRIRNAVRAEHKQVSMPSSKMKVAIAKILKDEGFIGDYEVTKNQNTVHKTLTLQLKYVGRRRFKRPVITDLERVSLPGQRIYAKNGEIPFVLSGLGIAILTTSKGVMTGRDAKKLGVGGEVVCKVW